MCSLIEQNSTVCFVTSNNNTQVILTIQLPRHAVEQKEKYLLAVYKYLLENIMNSP